MSLERYELMHDIWYKDGIYTEQLLKNGGCL